MAKSQWYTAGKRLLAEGKCNLAADELRVVLLTEKYQCDYQEHRRISDIGWESEGKGYDKGGLKLVNQRVVVVDGMVYLRADDMKIERTTLEAAGCAIVHHETGTLLAYLAREGGKKSASSFEHDFNIEWPKDGILWL